MTSLAVAAAGAGTAAAGTVASTVVARHNHQLDRTIVTDRVGDALYRLSGETSTHLKCTSRACLAVWLPLTVPTRATPLRSGAGVHGKLSVFHRRTGGWQVMLGGRPLYRFESDTEGTAEGQGIHGFGGTWDVLSAGASVGTPEPPSGRLPGF